jgi:zinc protease
MGTFGCNLRPLIYKNHPYKWATIGKEISHIEEAKMEDVKDFFYKFYSPQNAILVVGGNLDVEHVKELAKKWFGDVPKRQQKERNLTPEPPQTEERRLTIERNVPSDAIYLAFRMGGRKTSEHYIGDLCSDILAGSKSSRLYNQLIVKEKKFSSISAYITGSIDDGLFVISGHLQKGITFQEAETAIWSEIEKISTHPMDENELIKVKNKHKTGKVFSEQSLLNRVMNIAFFENLGMLNELNNELEKYDEITAADIQKFSKAVFLKTNQSILQIKSI